MKLLKGGYHVHAFVSPMDVGELLLPLYELYLRLLRVNDVTWKPNFCIIFFENEKKYPLQSICLEGDNYMRFTVAS